MTQSAARLRRCECTRCDESFTYFCFFFFFNDPATTEISPLSLPDALPICRERQIMDIVYRRGSATAAEIHAEMEDAPTYTTVRGLLRILAEKGRLAIGKDGARYVYRPT